MTEFDIINLGKVLDRGKRLITRLQALNRIGKELNDVKGDAREKFLPCRTDRPAYDGLPWGDLEHILLEGMRQSVEAASVKAKQELEALKL